MPLKFFRPITPTLRYTVLNRPEGVSTKRPERALTESKSKTGGRNCYGRLTSRRRGGGHKQLYRTIDFKRDKIGMPANVQAIEYDPNRSALIALVAYSDGTKSYILAPKGLKAGDRVISAAKCENNEYKPGDAYPLETIPPSTRVHAVELIPGRGAQLARSAGASLELVGIEGGNAQLTPAVRRTPPRERPLPRDHRRGRQRRARQRLPRQGRPQPLARPPSARPRHGDEPGRPPQRRRPGQVQGWWRPPAGRVAVGPARQGLPDPPPPAAVQQPDPRAPQRPPAARQKVSRVTPQTLHLNRRLPSPWPVQSRKVTSSIPT